MNTYSIENITQGESWGCKFRTVQMVNEQGELVNTQNIQPGQTIPGTPAIYESIGIIETRDLNKRLIQVRDIKSNRLFVVDWDNAWDIDRVEYRD